MYFSSFIQRHRNAHESTLNLSVQQVNPSIPPATPVFSIVFLWPTLCDLGGTTLGGIGLIYTPASVWQMLRGSIIIFSGALSVIFLKRKLHCHHWFGMSIVVAGLGLVGVSSLLGSHEKAPSADLILGIVMTLAGQLLGAIQFIVEEVFVKRRNYPALNVVGMEGLYGTLLMSAVVLPALYFVPAKGQILKNFSENSLEAFVQIYNSWFLLLFVLLYLVSIAFYNFFGLAVTKRLSAVHRTLIDACRTVVVWTIEIILYYSGLHKYGEGWEKNSYLQLGGFLLLVVGTVLYNGVVKLPCSTYTVAKNKPTEDSTETPKNNVEKEPFLAGRNDKEGP